MKVARKHIIQAIELGEGIAKFKKYFITISVVKSKSGNFGWRIIVIPNATPKGRS